jgi:hypothetical protein
MVLFTPVEPVPAAAPLHSLVKSAVQPRDDARWEQGFSWRSERCISSSVYDECAANTGTKIGPSNTINYYKPFAINVEEVCSTRTGDTVATEDRVRRQLEAVTPFRVARELWTGEFAQANPYATPESGGVPNVRNRWLAQVNGVQAYDGSFTPLDALGQLEELARRNYTPIDPVSSASMGQDVFIHAPIELAPAMANALVQVGNVLRTKTGATVVFDAAYLGTNPQGGAGGGVRWMYATGPVSVRLSPVQTRIIISHTTNERIAVAERVAAAYFDPCVHQGIPVSTPTT